MRDYLKDYMLEGGNLFIIRNWPVIYPFVAVVRWPNINRDRISKEICDDRGGWNTKVRGIYTTYYRTLC